MYDDTFEKVLLRNILMNTPRMKALCLESGHRESQSCGSMECLLPSRLYSPHSQSISYFESLGLALTRSFVIEAHRILHIIHMIDITSRRIRNYIHPNPEVIIPSDSFTNAINPPFLFFLFGRSAVSFTPTHQSIHPSIHHLYLH